MQNIRRLTYLLWVCSTVGFRSGKYAQQLMDEGFNVKNLKGSIVAWVSLASTFPFSET